MAGKKTKQKSYGDSIIYQINKTDDKVIQFYNMQSNYAEAFRFMVNKYIEEYGLIDCKYIIMQEELKKMGMSMPDGIMQPQNHVAQNETAATQQESAQPVSTMVQETMDHFIPSEESVVEKEIPTPVKQHEEEPIEEQEEPVVEEEEEIVEEENIVSDTNPSEIIKNRHSKAQGVPVGHSPIVKEDKEVDDDDLGPAVMPGLGDMLPD